MAKHCPRCSTKMVKTEQGTICPNRRCDYPRPEITPEHLRKINHIETISMRVLEAKMIEIAKRGRPATGDQDYEVCSADFLPKYYRLGDLVASVLSKRGFRVDLDDEDCIWHVGWEPKDNNAECYLRAGEEPPTRE